MVLEYTSGPLKGLFQIFAVAGEEPPTYLPFSDQGECEGVGCSLIRVTTRAVYYRELWMNPTGRLGSFHPEQR